MRSCPGIDGTVDRVGHAFAETEYPKIAEWLEKVALAVPAKK